MFKGLSKATVSSRLPDPRVGKADYLLNSMRVRENRDGSNRVQVSLTCLRGLTEGSDQKGDKVGIAIFSGDYFLTEFKRWVLAACGVARTDEEEVVEMACELLGDEVKGLDELDRAEKAWEHIAQLATAEGQGENAAGIFDNQVVIQIESIRKEGKDEGKGKMVDGVFVPEPIPTYLNSYPNRKVLFSELVDDLDEKDMKRFFGSEERFMELLEKEA